MALEPSQPWPGPDDRQVVNEMLNDPKSHHWEKCRNHIASYLQKLGIPADHLEDITQKAMLSVTQGLEKFRFEGKFTAWLGKIARSRKMDWLRDKARDKLPKGSIVSLDEIAAEGDEASAPGPTIEEQYLDEEALHEIRSALEEFASLQKDPGRVVNIFQRAFYEDVTQKDIAEPLNISPARVSQIIGEGLSYARKKMGLEPPAPSKNSR